MNEELKNRFFISTDKGKLNLETVYNFLKSGLGLGKWLVETMLQHPDLQGLRRWLLATKDAQELYRQFGFQEVKSSDSFAFMEIV